MLNKGFWVIHENELIADNIYKMVLIGESGQKILPGEFINIEVPGFFLRRPISVCDYDTGKITIIYKTIGKGTKELSALKKGSKLDVLTGLGKGFDLSKSGKSPVVVGGGMGAAPMLYLAKELLKKGIKPTVVLGFSSKNDAFLIDDFKTLSLDVFVATNDGSLGEKGFVTDALDKISNPTYFYACGPMPMLRAVCKKLEISGEVSLEERMGCGFGACMGCSIETANGAKRVCKDGPVFAKEDLIW